MNAHVRQLQAVDSLDEALSILRAAETSPTLRLVRVSVRDAPRPLDWIVITDHSDGMGLITDVLASAPNVMKYDQGRRWSEGFNAGGQEATAATIDA